MLSSIRTNVFISGAWKERLKEMWSGWRTHIKASIKFWKETEMEHTQQQGEGGKKMGKQLRGCS